MITNTEEFRTSRRRTMNHDLSLPAAKSNAALGLGEAGELQNIVKKEVFHGHPLNANAVMDETGDILFYLDWLADLYGFTLLDAMNYNAEKLAKRYPEGFSSERSINRS